MVIQWLPWEKHGRLCEVHDVINGRVTVYDYDAQGRLYHTYQYDTDDGYIDLNSVVRYDTQNRPTEVIDKISYPVAQSTATSVISQSHGYTRGQLTLFYRPLFHDAKKEIMDTLYTLRKTR